MEVQINCRLKVASGVCVGPGLFNDEKGFFHPKVYGEIVLGRPTVRLLSGSMEEAIEKAGPEFAPQTIASKTTETRDPGTKLDTTTSEPKRSSGRRRTRK